MSRDFSYSALCTKRSLSMVAKKNTSPYHTFNSASTEPATYLSSLETIRWPWCRKISQLLFKLIRSLGVTNSDNISSEHKDSGCNIAHKPVNTLLQTGALDSRTLTNLPMTISVHFTDKEKKKKTDENMSPRIIQRGKMMLCDLTLGTQSTDLSSSASAMYSNDLAPGRSCLLAKISKLAPAIIIISQLTIDATRRSHPVNYYSTLKIRPARRSSFKIPCSSSRHLERRRASALSTTQIKPSETWKEVTTQCHVQIHRAM
jgi:hypothetical protein